ncbi:hypothetical protein BIFCAT_00595 [Bifidobacterium catenulatum DSM 16992 = JCM 1194 = LMG 11043]|uniref:Uncharacterized protein n=1 Tax=Bifidobacterium catenulatum DSM 16992 = JCM 1194 = LMG 11043 TaxID=566552 RepID=B6XU54_9BIFI|nr:hypothetical protein BIFCAT_00595 [Bifidobacterium catenulatum DSM 16992 = JCM 1194 = LMG 11043]
MSDSSTATKPDPAIRNVLMAGPVIFPENQTSQQPYGNAGRSPLNIHGLPARQKTYQ